MATAPAVKESTPVVAEPAQVLLFSVYPSYTLVVQEDKYAYREGGGMDKGKLIKQQTQEGLTLQFMKSRAFVSEDLMATLRKKPWYGSDFLTAEDLAKLYKSQPVTFQQITGQMYDRAVIARLYKPNSREQFQMDLLKDLMFHGGLDPSK